MKFRNITFFLLIIIIITAVSCSGFLDQAPEHDRLTIEKTFSTKKNVRDYLANIYSHIPDYNNQRYGVGGAGNIVGPWAGSSDEAEYRWPFEVSNSVNLGSYNASSDWVNTLWQDYYKGIRSATYFLNHINECKKCREDLRVQYKAEARALRAYYYYLLMRMFGPVVLLKKNISHSASQSEVQLPRAPFDTLVNYVAAQLDEAMPHLPFKPTDNSLYGRVTQGFALGIKVKLFTMAARPLFNGNSYYADMKNPDGTQLISQKYDKSKWKRAANTAKHFIDKFVPNTYKLYKEYDDDGNYSPYLSERDLFLEDWNSGVIYENTRSSVTSRQYEETPSNAGTCSEAEGSGAFGITQEMVDRFFTANGRTIWDPKSGYKKSGFSMFKAPFDFKKRKTYNQWIDREPRFYADVTYNNSLWLYRGCGDIISQFNYTGNSGIKVNGNDYSPTGYVVRKNMHLGDQGTASRGLIIMRLAQIYLDYIETLNEVDPENPDILKYLNKIRERAGIPEYGSSSLPEPQSQDSMRQAIRHERTVELSFEVGDRYFYTREWKIADKTDNGPLHGLDIHSDPPDFYDVITFEKRVTSEKNYLLPIPQHEISTDKNLAQNSGW